MHQYELVITITLNIILATTSTIALWTIRMKPTRIATSFDFTLGHTFFSQTLFSLATTVSTLLLKQRQHSDSIWTSTNNNDGSVSNRNNITATHTIAEQREALWEHVVTASAMMFLQNSFIFITLTSVQQFLAVYFPLKIKAWVTRRRTNVFFATVYAGSVVFHTTIFFVLGFRSVPHMNALGFGFWSMSGVMVIMYTVVSFKLTARACTRRFAGKSRATHGQSRTTGNFQDKKTVVILLIISSGALCTAISLLVKQHNGYGLVVLVTQYMQWIIASSVFIFVNRNVLKTRFSRHFNTEQFVNTSGL